jgi:predicted ester cyclase
MYTKYKKKIVAHVGFNKSSSEYTRNRMQNPTIKFPNCQLTLQNLVLEKPPVAQRLRICCDEFPGYPTDNRMFPVG